MSLRALEHAGTSGGEDGHAHQEVSMQYENLDQQNESYIVGMWSFLVTEIMFFGALFLVYSLYRVLYYNTYLEAHQFLNVWWGTLNTTVLLTSSFTMVMSVYWGQCGNRGKVIAYLLATCACAFAFMGVKYIEYSGKFKEGLFPNARFNYARALTMHDEAAKKSGKAHHALSPRHEMAWKALVEARKEAPVAFGEPKVGFIQTTSSLKGAEIKQAVPSLAWGNFEREARKARIFFSIYFTMTGLHGVHVLVGILLMGALLYFYWIRHKCVEDYIPLELVGLYWHFVDIVWIFLFPLMYLIS